MAKRIGIVGAGLGGLALALRLAHRGCDVTVFEKTGDVGGRNREQRVGDCVFDGGPTLLMMLDPFRKLFNDVGERLEDHVQISLCDPSYRVFYSDGTRLDATTCVARMIREIAEKIDPAEVPRYLKLLGDLAELYHEAIPNFVRTNYSRPADVLHPAQLWRVLRTGMLGSLSRRVARSVHDERLRMLFSFQTMYLGLSPYDAPFVYGTLTYMEFGEGIWYPQGGLPEISRAVARLAQAKGVKIRLNQDVKRITANAIETSEVEEFDLVVANADMPYAQRSLAGKPSRRKLRYSCSALVLYLDYEGELPDLLHHSIFFGKDFRGNLNMLFHDLRIPDDPAFYACISSRTEESRAPKGHENLYLLIPCPNLDLPWTEEGEAHLVKQVFARLQREVGFDPGKVRQMAKRTPETWKSELNLERGAAFGISHDLFQSAFMRPPNYKSGEPLYVGASTTPGNGLPMVLISAELAERRLEEAGMLDVRQEAHKLEPGRPDAMSGQEEGLVGRLVGDMIRRSVRSSFRRVCWNPPQNPLTPPVILYANHHGWFDGYVIFEAVTRLGIRTLDWMEEFEVFPLFRSVGARPYPKGDPIQRAKTVRETIGLMKRESRSLVLFPEGILHYPPEIFPFGRSLAFVAQKVPGCQVVPLAISYENALHQRPEAFLRFGTPLGPSDDPRDALVYTLENLRRDVRSGASFEVLVEGRKSVNERWSLAKRDKS